MMILAAGELAGPVPEPIGEPHLLQALHGTPLALDPRHALVEERHLDVLDHVQLADQVEGLEDEADALTPHAAQLVVVHLGDVAPVEAVGPRAEAVQAAEDVHEGALARSGGPHDRHVLTRQEVQVDATEGLDEHRAVGLKIGLAHAEKLGDRRMAVSGECW
jgi:hypothetical protein